VAMHSIGTVQLRTTTPPQDVSQVIERPYEVVLILTLDTRPSLLLGWC